MMFVILTLTMIVGSMAAGLRLASQVERQIAATHRRVVQLGYAAESAAEQVVTALEAAAEWNEVPGAFVAAPAAATPALAARTAELNTSAAGRFPFGPDTPAWRLVATRSHEDTEAAVWVADDPADKDGDAAVDANGRLMVFAEARSAAGAVRSVEVHLARQDGTTRRLSWREVW